MITYQNDLQKNLDTNRYSYLIIVYCKFCLVPLHRGNCFHRYHTLVKY